MPLMTKRFTCDAVLFDLDGVLVDSTASIERHWRQWAAKHGIDAEDVLRVVHGRRAVETVRLVAPHLSAESESRDVARSESQDAADVLGVAGAAELLAALPPDTWAIVTSATYAAATVRLRQVGLPLPPVLVSAEDIVHGKPHPEGYLKAASLLSVPAERCVVIEDAPPGVEAAHAAGMAVIAVTTTHPAAELLAADARVPALADIWPHTRAVSSNGTARLELVLASG